MSSAYAKAIDATRDALVDRARRYKRLVIAVSVAGVAAFGTLLAGHGAGLQAYAALLPASVLAFSLLDALAVQRWRAQVLGLWIDGRLQLDVFLHTMRQVPGMPEHTVAGMLETLPGRPADAVPLPLRSVLGHAVSLVGRLDIEHMLLRALTAALGGLAIMLALWFDRWVWLALAVLALPAFGAWQFDACRRARRFGTRAALQLAASEISPELCAAWMTPLPWQGVPAAIQAAWRSGLAGGGAPRSQACRST